MKRNMRVSKRGGFSDRYAIKPENVEIQLKDFDERTRVQLRNMVSQLYAEVYENQTRCYNSWIQSFLRYVLGTVYAEPVDATQSYDDEEVFAIINHTLMCDDYDDVLTLIEALAQYWDGYLKNSKGYLYYDKYVGYRATSVYEKINLVFKREYIGYRFIGELIVPISDENEVQAIKEALDHKYAPVSEHILKANLLLADRENLDYENSIKESISAIEAFCEILTGVHGREATLGRMIKKLEDNGVNIHSGLKAAFNTLYGYTNDANGIRHAGDIGGAASTFEEAKFMLVSCSAFVNYLTALSKD